MFHVVTLNGDREFSIGFEVMSDMGQVICNICENKKNSLGTEFQEFISGGYSICHPKDNFSRAVGRKLALTKALKNLPKDLNNKEFRTLVWEAYKDTGAKLSDKKERTRVVYTEFPLLPFEDIVKVFEKLTSK